MNLSKVALHYFAGAHSPRGCPRFATIEANIGGGAKLKIHATSDALYSIQPQSRGDLINIIAVIVTLAIGAIAVWLAGVLVEGAGFGLVLLGIAGAFIAALLFPRLGLGLTLGGGIVGAIVTSALGAVVNCQSGAATIQLRWVKRRCSSEISIC